MITTWNPNPHSRTKDIFVPNSEISLLRSEALALSDRLPADIAAYQIKLLMTRHSVTQFGRTMDGYLFGVIGADGVVSMIPVVGDIFCGLMTFWLVAKARQVRMSMGERLVMIGLGALDTVIGMVPVVGDVADFFFRSHGWSSKRVEAHIDMQLLQIEAVGPLPNHHPHMEQLRDALFRGGKTRQEIWLRLGIIVAGCVALLSYCSYEASQEAQRRHERYLMCQKTGGWFCSWRQ